MKRRPSGLTAWWVQRASAVFLLGFTVYFLGSLLLLPPVSYAAWRAWLGQSAMLLGLVLFFSSLLAHIWVGTRDVLLDYVKPASLRKGLMGLLTGILGLIGGWVLWLVFTLSA